MGNESEKSLEQARKILSRVDKTKKVNHIDPGYYIGSEFQVIDVIEQFKLNHHEANIIKYVVRNRHKNPDNPVQDLKKARWYIDRLINQYENR
tara:strand:+ start:81 stop:359 length:279 start_codon:yes stop_codon:yes gene_type:complete